MEVDGGSGVLGGEQALDEGRLRLRVRVQVGTRLRRPLESRPVEGCQELINFSSRQLAIAVRGHVVEAELHPGAVIGVVLRNARAAVDRRRRPSALTYNRSRAPRVGPKDSLECAGAPC